VAHGPRLPERDEATARACARGNEEAPAGARVDSRQDRVTQRNSTPARSPTEQPSGAEPPDAITNSRRNGCVYDPGRAGDPLNHRL
jgi:hypothetical protein